LKPRAIHRWHTRAAIDEVIYILFRLEGFRFAIVIEKLSGDSAGKGSAEVYIFGLCRSYTIYGHSKENGRGIEHRFFML